MMLDEQAKILLVDDQPAKLLTYEEILKDLDVTLLKASSAQEAFRLLLNNDVAVILVDVYMPELDGFQLASMIRDHPRFEKTAIIFISAICLSELDRLRGYRERRRRLRALFPWCPKFFGPRSRSFSNFISRRAIWNASIVNSKIAWPKGQRNSKRRTNGCRRAKSA